MASNLSASSKNFSDYISPLSSKFTLNLISTKEVNNLIESINPDKSTGMDDIPPKLLKIAAPIVSESLAFIFNRCIDSSIYPDEWKAAKVIPIHKKDDKDDVNNYRPISVILCIAKIFERVVYNQLYAYIESNNILNEHQSGFRSLHSTVTLLLDATNDWFNNIDNGLLNLVVYVMIWAPCVYIRDLL